VTAETFTIGFVPLPESARRVADRTLARRNGRLPGIAVERNPKPRSGQLLGDALIGDALTAQTSCLPSGSRRRSLFVSLAVPITGAGG
jgi:hypothetical protein